MTRPSSAISSIPSVYKSTDNGESWQPVTEGLSGAVVQTLVVSGSTVFGGSTYKGVWESTDNGETWIDVGAGLSGPGLKIIGLTASAGNLFAASSNGGIWKRPLSQVVSVQEPSPRAPLSQFTLDQNYPNPFNPSTMIRYGLAGTGTVHLAIYDLLGREVAALVDQRREAGSYEVRFDGSGISTGVYVCRLSAGSTTLSRAMLLLR